MTSLAPVSGENVASRIAGKIVEVNFHQGDRVKAGDLLLRLDTTKLDLEIARMRRAIQTEEEEVQRLRAIEKTLDEQEAAAIAKLLQEIEEAARGVERETARVDRARAERRLVELALEKAREKQGQMRGLVEDGLEPVQKLRDAERDLKEAEARLEASRVEESEVRLARERRESTRKQEAIVRKEFQARRDELRLRLDGKRGSIESAGEALKSLEFDRGECEIRARVGGVVTQGHPREGDYVEPGKPFAAIAQEVGLRIDVGIPAAEVGQIRPGMKARVKFDSYDYQDYGTMEGEIYYVSPDSELIEGAGGMRVAVYMVRIRLDGDEVGRNGRRGKIKLGMTAQVEIQLRRERLSKLFLTKVREKISL